MTLLWLAACGDPIHPGTAVGNPGDADVKARSSDPDLHLDEISVPVDAVEVDDCDDVATYDRRTVLDGLHPSPHPVRVPGGLACAITLELSDPVEIRGSTTAGTTFVVRLPVDELSVDLRFRVDGQHLLVDLPLALEAPSLDALGPVVDLEPDDPLAEAWADDSRAVTLWNDRNGDGLLTTRDGLVQELQDTAVPAALALSDSDEGCKCAAPGRPAGGALVLVLIVFGRRRRYPR